jgi:hypothetical protein
MDARLIGRRISQTYAIVVLLLGLLLLLVAGLLFRAVHVGGEIATVTLPPGLVFVALSPFIWRGMAWANFAAFALSVLYVLLALNFSLQDPQFGWFLIIPALFGTFSVAHIVVTSKTKAT